MFVLNFSWFKYYLISHQKSWKLDGICNCLNQIIVDGISIVKLTWSVKYNQYVIKL
jgi:hypothetical protein